MRRLRLALFATVIMAGPPPGLAHAQQFNAARLAILNAEDHRASTAAELARLRTAVLSGDLQNARLAVRAMGRLERPALVADILPALNSRFAEVQAEAANAVAQAVSSRRRGMQGGPPTPALLQALRAHLGNDEDSSVRGAMIDAIGRLPYSEAADVAQVQALFAQFAADHRETADRLGLARAYEAFVRLNKNLVLSPASTDVLRDLAGVPGSGSESAAATATTATAAPADARAATAAAAARARFDAPRDARVRRLALEALTTANAVDAALLDAVAGDSDIQVRRLAVRAAARAKLQPYVTKGLEDLSPMVRYEAIRGLADRTGADVCAWLMAATVDRDPHVALQAIDQLSACGDAPLVATRLADLAGETRALAAPREWHRPAHALVALATAAPERAASVLPAHVSAPIPFVRAYAVRAAAALKDGDTLDRLATDASDNVVEAAVAALSALVAADAAPRYVAALSRPGYQAVRAAARALATPAIAARSDRPQIVEALTTTLARLTAENHENSTDAQTALMQALEALGSPSAKSRSTTAADGPRVVKRPIDPTLEELRRLAAPRARIRLRDLGVIDVALITSEAPLTVVQLARLAERGYFNGLTIHRVVPNFVLQGGSPDANEYVGHPDYMRDEVGTWPHVRGALGISTRGRDTGDAQFFIDMVDNPRLDHDYTVFGQVIAGMDVAERVLEGDVIESVQILTR